MSNEYGRVQPMKLFLNRGTGWLFCSAKCLLHRLATVSVIDLDWKPLFLLSGPYYSDCSHCGKGETAIRERFGPGLRSMSELAKLLINESCVVYTGYTERDRRRMRKLAVTVRRAADEFMLKQHPELKQLFFRIGVDIDAPHHEDEGGPIFCSIECAKAYFSDAKWRDYNAQLHQ